MESVQDFCDRGVDEPVRLADAGVNLPNGRGPEIPQRDENCLLECATGEISCVRHPI
jgi:hypothetical protein